MKKFRSVFFLFLGIAPLLSGSAFAEVKTTSAGVEFTSTEEELFGKGWIGPDKSTWGYAARDADGKPKYMFRDVAFNYCKDLGGELPSQADYKIFQDAKGEELFSGDFDLGLKGSLKDVQEHVAPNGKLLIMGNEFLVAQVPGNWECDETNKYWTSDQSEGKDKVYNGIYNLCTGQFHQEGTDGIQVPLLVRCIKKAVTAPKEDAFQPHTVKLVEQKEEQQDKKVLEYKRREVPRYSDDVVTFSFAGQTFTGSRSQIHKLPNGDSVVANPNEVGYSGFYYGRDDY